MAHHASAKKALRQNVKLNAANRARVSEIRTYIKKVEEAIADKNINLAQEIFKITQSKIMRGSHKNMMKPNTASRKVSRLAHKIKAIETAA